MFELLAYKKRLTNVRTELEALLELVAVLEQAPELEVIQNDKVVATVNQDDIAKLARGIAGVCRILIRVIDSIPGAP
jgi:hypothetical protein